MKGEELLNQNQVDENEIDFLQIFKILYKKKFFIILVTFFVSLLSAIYSLQIPNTFKSFAVLVPVESSKNRPQSGTLSSLANLAGISIQSGGVSNKTISIELMKSWGFIEKFIKKNELEVKIYASKGWDRRTDQIIIDNKIYDSKNQKWLRKENEFKKSEPSSWELYEAFKGMLNISEDELTGLVTVSFEHFSPTFSKKIVEMLVDEINQYSRLNSLEKAKKNLEYLNVQILREGNVTTRGFLYSLVESELENKMIAEVNYDHVFITAQKPMVPELKNSPQRFLIVAMSVLIAMVFSIFYVLTRHYFLKDLKITSK
jgi:LPS O-antigen subunit length determinant protein (WzzB/FepE family)